MAMNVDRLNGKVMTLHRKVKKLTTRFDNLGIDPDKVRELLENLQATKGNIFLAGAKTHLTDTQIKQALGIITEEELDLDDTQLITELITSLGALRGTVHVLQEDVQGLDTRVKDIEDNSLFGYDVKKTAVTINQPSIEVETPWGEAIIVGLVVGVLTALAFWSWTDWSDSRTIGISIIFGVAALFFMSSFEKFKIGRLVAKLVWARREVKDNTEEPPAARQDGSDDTRELKREVNA